MTAEKKLRVACLQMTSSSSVEQNLGTISTAFIDAPAIDLIVLPENFAQMPVSRHRLYSEQEDSNHTPVINFLKHLAAQTGATVVAGSLPILTAGSTKPLARCLIVSADGVTRHYDKVHLFDVDVSSRRQERSSSSPKEPSEHYRESDNFQAGSVNEQQISPHILQFGPNTIRLGASICYDLRFPELYRGFSRRGVDVITVPAAFTHTTGHAHWEILLKARAIENQAFVVAAAQVGVHENGRRTWGHSMIIDPWGEKIGEIKDQPSLLYAQLDLNDSERLKQRFPVLDHRRID